MAESRGSYDFLVVGAGIIGLGVAQELKKKFPDQSIVVIEKENQVGQHSSGRNSGVLHSGIYYPTDSYKAKFSDQGRRELTEFCQQHNLPFKKIGKILIPVNEGDGPLLDVLYERGLKNGVQVEHIDGATLRRLEPEAHSLLDRALFIPTTSIANPRDVIKKKAEILIQQGVDIIRGEHVVEFDVRQKVIRTRTAQYSYGFLINSAGLHADRVAHSFNVGKDYTLLPFKGIYWKMRKDSGLKINHLVYPVPDLRVPFLGVHTTTSTDGEIYFGPTAVPAFGRENYRGLQDVNFRELAKILRLIGMQLITNRDGFRRLAWQEGRRYFKPWFVQAAKAVIPRLEARHLNFSDKVGIRAQMFHKPSGRLANDFVVERGPDSVHILNAISPAWTCSGPFAKMIVNEYIEGKFSK